MMTPLSCRKWPIAALLLLNMLALPSPALAWDLDHCNASGSQTAQPWEFTTKVVACLQGTIINAATGMMAGMSTYMTPVIAIMLMFAIIIFGVRIIGGERELTGKAIGFSLRAGIVLAMSINLGGLLPLLFGMENQLISIVTQGFGAPSGWSPWQQIDAILANLFGFGPGNSASCSPPSFNSWNWVCPNTTTQDPKIYEGIMGLIGGSLFASSVGVLLFIGWLIGLINLLLFIFNLVYTYLAAVLVMAFMAIISPIVIPMGLFFSTERYVRKWLDILLGSMLMPILLFAFLSMFLGIFNLLVGSVFGILGGNDFTAYEKLSKPAFSWSIPTDPSTKEKAAEIAASDPNSQVKNIPPVQTTINPFAHDTFDAGLFNFPAIDFGPDNIRIMQALVLYFISIAIFSYLLTGMLSKIPELASSIANIAYARAPLISSSPQQRLQEAKENIAMGFGGVTGGAVGGVIGKAAGNLRGGKASRKHSGLGSQIGGVLGSIAGSLMGRKI